MATIGFHCISIGWNSFLVRETPEQLWKKSPVPPSTQRWGGNRCTLNSGANCSFKFSCGHDVTRLPTLMMFMGPMTLVSKELRMSSAELSSRVALHKTPALLTSRLRPPAPTVEPTSWAHSLMLPRLVASVGGREKNADKGQSEQPINIAVPTGV